MSKISISLLEGYHITATDKRHIAAIVERGWREGVTRQRRYKITEKTGDIVRLVIERSERDMQGRPMIRRSKVVVRIGGGQGHA
ncbi:MULTISPECIES: hypothetical protein [Brucella]|uniref:Uncharacterized protein n=1 Tax=Brucella daejeonensis TaxID=659015 RepID=A0A7W9B0S2_9HYPH|nr:MULTISPECIES: hypothetical protein [Brucella]MBB5704117.1 hypothetical protein [Brucella daejeonensis]UZD72176.1 hypothetical protein LJ361_23450 [Brucella sp. JSBI001]